MGSERQSKQMKEQRRPPRTSGVRQVVAGCVIFGAGVAVGAMLGPLAGPKTPVSSPRRVAARKPVSPLKSPAKRKKTAEQKEKSEQLTFFQTLKEAPAQSNETYVPFKPKGEAPPTLEALAKKGVEADEPSPEAAQLDVKSVATSPPPSAVTQYYVQVATFQYADNARRLTQELRGHGYSAFAVGLEARRKPYKVKVGPYESRSSAEKVADRLQKMFLYPTSVVTKTRP